MECLTAMKEYKTALEYYEQVAADSQREFGMLPSEELVQCYRSIKNMIQFELSNIEEIQNHLQPDADTFGATRCDYLTFIDIYRYIVWVLERKGTKAYLALITIVDKEGVPLEISELLEETRQELEKAIRFSVRRSDLYTRYGRNQFLILMTGTDRKGCEIAANRIKSRFNSQCRRKRVNIYYTYQPALEVQDDDLRNNVDQGMKEWNKH